MKNLIKIIFLITACISLSAVSVIKLSFKEVVNRADRIVHVRFLETKNDKEYTIYTIDILKQLKGLKTQKLQLRELHSVNKNIGLKIAGDIKFEKDSESVLFLTKDNNFGYPAIVGYNQGCYKIVVENGQKFVFYEGKKMGLEAFYKEIEKYLSAK